MTAEMSPQEHRLDLMRRIQTEGVEAAYQAALAVCKDVSAPAPARATCATTLFRAAGYLVTKEDTGTQKQPHEMTPTELQAAIKELQTRRRATFDGDSSVFD